MARVPRIGGGDGAARASARTEVPPHFCPGCGAQQKAFARYPWYFCRDCVQRAEDRQGRSLAFANQSFSGGFAWRYADDETRWDPKALGVICLIDRRRVIVGEARFGGVVAQPLADETGLHPAAGRGIVDLTTLTPAEAGARMIAIEPPT